MFCDKNVLNHNENTKNISVVKTLILKKLPEIRCYTLYLFFNKIGIFVVLLNSQDKGNVENPILKH